MSSYTTYQEKYEDGGGKSFWVNTFKNVFTYALKNNKMVLNIWDGESSQFCNIDESSTNLAVERLKKAKKVILKDGVVCYRIELDNNKKLFDEKGFNVYYTNYYINNYSYYGIPALIRIGSDNYLVSELSLFSTVTKNYNKHLKSVISSCIDVFGDGVERFDGEYYWNFVDEAIDTYYESYRVSDSLLNVKSIPFEINYEAHGCVIDKYKEEDSSYVVDRYF